MKVRIAVAGGLAALVLAACGGQTSAPPSVAPVLVSTAVVTVTATVAPSPSVSPPSSAPVSSSAAPSPDHLALVALCKKYCADMKKQRNKPSCDPSTVDGCTTQVSTTGGLVITLQQDLPASGVDIGLHLALRKSIDDAMDAWNAADFIGSGCAMGGPAAANCGPKFHGVLTLMDAVGMQLQTEAAAA